MPLSLCVTVACCIVYIRAAARSLRLRPLCDDDDEAPAGSSVDERRQANVPCCKVHAALRIVSVQAEQQRCLFVATLLGLNMFCAYVLCVATSVQFVATVDCCNDGLRWIWVPWSLHKCTGSRRCSRRRMPWQRSFSGTGGRCCRSIACRFGSRCTDATVQRLSSTCNSHKCYVSTAADHT